MFLVLVGAGSALAYSSGPPDGRTNAPGEGNCTACHTSFPLNSGSGLLEIVGLPGDYVPGAIYPLEVKLSDPSAQRWGFEFTIIDQSGVSAGTLAPTDANTQISTGGPFGRTYVKHTTAGTNLGQTGQNTWLVNWQAPAAGAGGLGLFVAGNAANGNLSNTGDRIYTASFTTAEGAVSSVPDRGMIARLSSPYPNPFNPRTVVGFSLGKPGLVTLAIYTVRGVRVSRIYSGELDAGDHSFVWKGTDEGGAVQSSGLYFARLTDGRGRDLAPPVKMTLAR